MYLSDAQVDLNPHQIEAALFALSNPLSGGKILADEVGLGKTVESGLVISQKWAEGKRKILIIAPANLRTQWQTELSEKFYLESMILDGNSFVSDTKKGVNNPFEQDCIVITSYNFAGAKAEYIKQIEFDLVVIDEAHRLRNVYKPNSIIAHNIQEATRGRFKLLATATPLQNSLLELFGLVSFVDDHVFGDLESFRQQFLYLKSSDARFSDLTDRLHSVCIRTLRRQVVEYINYTRRQLITQEFKPLKDEQILYDKVSAYLRKERLWALPSSQRYLVSLILWKQLASSTFAVAGTLHKLAVRLQITLDKDSILDLDDLEEGMTLKDYEYTSQSQNVQKFRLNDKEKAEIQSEIDSLTEFYHLAISIKENAKGKALLLALEKGFQKLKEISAPKKAVIFTESRRTQEYLAQLLNQTKYKDQYCLYFGGMKKEKMEEVKNDFKNNVQIMIATEAAAEGANLQFCAMIINYDLPWNPQRIEQRIGRCHRYGQKHDVIVINFLNQENVADQRVYELLCDKFQLFEGVFGASDGVLGSIDSLDFEKRMLEIYQKCRTKQEIEESFTAIKEMFQESIDETMKDVKHKLLENFDEEVTQKLRFNADSSQYYLNRADTMLWELTKYYLKGYADFFEDRNVKAFRIHKNPFKAMRKQPPNYILRFRKDEPKGSRYRLNSMVAQNMIFDIQYNYQLPYDTVVFDWTGHKPKISSLEPLLNQKGYLSLYKIKVSSGSMVFEEHLVFVGLTESGELLSKEQLQCIWNLSGESNKMFFRMQNLLFEKKRGEIDNETYEYEMERLKDGAPEQIAKRLQELYQGEKEELITYLSETNARLFDEEMEKLEKWAKDVKISMEKSIKTIDATAKEYKVTARKAIKLEEKLELQKKIKELEAKRNQQRYELYEEQDKIDTEKDRLINKTQKRLRQEIKEECLFIIQWKIV